MRSVNIPKQRKRTGFWSRARCPARSSSDPKANSADRSVLIPYGIPEMMGGLASAIGSGDRQSIRLADHVYVLENGRIVRSGSETREDAIVQQAYLGRRTALS